MRYLNPDEHLRTKKELSGHYARMQSWAIREGKALRWLDKVPRDSRILECGCGSGYFARELLGAGFTDIHTTDIDDFVVFDEVRKIGHFTKVDLSFDRFPFGDATFDLIIAQQVLEHVENPWHAVREFKRLLKKGGRCIISIPRADALPYRWSFLIHRSPDVLHMPVNNDVNFFIPDLLQRLFRNSEWRLEWVDYPKSFIRLTSKRKIRLPDWLWINKILARRIAFSFFKV